MPQSNSSIWNPDDDLFWNPDVDSSMFWEPEEDKAPSAIVE